MAIGLVALGLKSMFGGKQPPKPGQQVQMPKQPGPTPAQTAPKQDEEDKPLKAPKVTKVKGPSSPLPNKTGIIPLDKSLTNISKSLGDIKTTLYSKQKFDKEKRETVQKTRAKTIRKRREKKAEAGGALAGMFSPITGGIRKGMDWMGNFLTNIIVGSLAVFLIKNINKVIDFVKDVRDKIGEVVTMIGDNLITPIWNMGKAVIGPIYKSMKDIGVIPDYSGEENELLKLANDLTLQIPIIGDYLEDIQDQVRKMKLDLDIKDTPGQTPPADRPDYQPGGDSPSPGPSPSPSGDQTRDITTTQPTSYEAPGAVKTPNEANKVVSDMGFKSSDWNVYRNTVAQIESGGQYDIKGGSNDHYDGRYQMGADAKTDAAKYLGVPNPGHGPAARERFRKDPQMQENFFAAFTQANHTYLMGVPEYAKANPRRKLQILGYAHNQGMGNAEKWMKTGVVGRDGFGTKGTKYTDAIREAFRSRTSQLPPADRPDYKPQVQPQTPIMGEAYKTGLKTGSSQYIGGSSDYHIDTKFPASLSPDKAVAMVDQMSRAYAEQGREIEFSNSAVSGLVYDHNAPYATKLALLQRVFNAHAPRNGWRSMDYYIPLKSDAKGRFGASAEGAEIVTPTIPGGKIEYHEGGRYGAFVVVVDENGNVISKTGHGDIRGSRSGTVIDIPKTQNTQSDGVNRNTSYEKPKTTTIVMPQQPTQRTRYQGGQRSSPSAGGGNSRASLTHTYLTAQMKHKTYTT